MRPGTQLSASFDISSRIPIKEFTVTFSYAKKVFGWDVPVPCQLVGLCKDQMTCEHIGHLGIPCPAGPGNYHVSKTITVQKMKVPKDGWYKVVGKLHYKGTKWAASRFQER